MTIREFSNNDVFVLHKGERVLKAAIGMRDQHIGCVVVIDESEGRRVPVGLLTDRDIVVAVVALGLDAEEVTVGDVMSNDLHVIRAHESIADALEIMRANGIRRLPVVDKNGDLEGIVSADDLLASLADEISSLGRIVAYEQLNERQKRRVKV